MTIASEAGICGLSAPSAFVVGKACVEPDGIFDPCSGTPINYGGTTTQSLSYSTSTPGIGAGSLYQLSVLGAATFGTLSSASTTSLVDPVGTTSINEVFTAVMIEALTINGAASLIGTAGSLVVGLTVSGTASHTGSGRAGWAVELSESYGDPDFQEIAGQTGQVTFLAIPFTFVAMLKPRAMV